MNRALQVACRVDASMQIGTGHVMRCLTLADALRDRGAQCHFICRDHPGHLGERIRAHGHELTLLAPSTADWRAAGEEAYAAWLGADLEDDARQTAEALSGKTPDWLIVDHYALDARWETELRSAAGRIMVLDDLADRPHDCDLLLDQNLGRSVDDYAAWVSSKCVVLTGPRYALLKPEFSALRDRSMQRRRAQELQHILVSMGGVDAADATSRVLRALRDLDLPKQSGVVVVMGSRAPWLDSVREALSESPWRSELLVDVTNMAELMVESDLAIGAAGSTSWERCSLGLPSVLFALADNQIASARALGDCGAAQYAGGVDDIAAGLPAAVSRYQSGQVLGDASAAAARVTDGRGCRRVASRILAFDAQWDLASVRPMGEADLDAVRAWRNHPSIRASMYSQHEIDAEEHRRWFERCMADEKRYLLIVERAGELLGFAQFHEAAAAVADWGFYTAPTAGKGTGTLLGRTALTHAFGALGLHKVNGQAIASNAKSIGLHRKLGFSHEGTLRKQYFDGRDYIDVLCFGLVANEFVELG